MTDTAATFIPISYKVLAFFNFSQFISRTVFPAEIPRICVCTAPDTPTVHRSDPELFIDGDIADAGGDLTVVVESEFTVLLVVDSVTIGSTAIAAVVVTIIVAIAMIIFLII